MGNEIKLSSSHQNGNFDFSDLIFTGIFSIVLPVSLNVIAFLLAPLLASWLSELLREPLRFSSDSEIFSQVIYYCFQLVFLVIAYFVCFFFIGQEIKKLWFSTTIAAYICTLGVMFSLIPIFVIWYLNTAIHFLLWPAFMLLGSFMGHRSKLPA